MVKVVVNSEGCISCGACVAICPNIFEFLKEDNKSHVKKQPETEEEIKCAKEAAEACPVQVIEVIEE
jgi:ferredoxin